MGVFEEDIQEDVAGIGVIVLEGDAVEEFGMGFGNILPALDTLHGFYVIEAVFLEILQEFLNIGAGRADDVHVDGEPVTIASQQNHQRGSAFPYVRTAGIGEHLYKRESSDDFLDEVDIRITEIGGDLLYPLFGEAFLAYHRPSWMNSCSNCSRQCLRPA